MQCDARRRQRLVDDDRGWRRVVEQQHDLREQTVPASEVDDTAAAKVAADALRHLPGFVQLFTRQAARMAGGAGDAVKQRAAGKAIEVAIGEAGARRRRKRRGA